jgi:hypothetical protein
MRRFPKIRSLKHASRLVSMILICMGQAAQGSSAGKEPIAYIGHGAMFDQKGQEVAPTISFIREAQAWYRGELIGKLTKPQQTQFYKFERELAGGLTLDEQSRLVLNAHLLDWLINSAKVEDGDRIRGKNNLMKAFLKTKLSNNPDAGLPRSTEPFHVNPELLKRLTTTQSSIPAKRPVPELLTNTGGAAYRALCLANGVPIPPDMGDPGWVSRGVIPKSELFISKAMDAEVLTFQSAQPPGMCIALPRFDGNNIVQLDGVICLGQSAKACFWDNDKNGTVFTFTRGTSRPFSDFGGGTELVGNTGGICSDCHAGENPYVIHGAVLGGLAGLGLPTFAPSWHEPLVRTGDANPWPENPGPMNAPKSCVGCHIQGVAGRFPHLSDALPAYCGTVLKLSIEGREEMPLMPKVPATMPPFAPGSLKGTPEMTALQNWCNSAATGDASGRGDPHITTFDRVNYDLQSAGEFVYLRDADGLEIQTRQTPIATTFDPGPDPHTGLASCVSVNTAVAARVGEQRVSFEPSFTKVPESSGLELRVDGKPANLGAQGINLGGGGRVLNAEVGSGIEIDFPDKTRLIVTTNFWESQNKWYLNVDVVNTPGREGVMGAIAPRSWLPLLPDGTSMGPIPASLHQRYVDLNQKFADAWRVTDTTSLFDYAPGTSTATFTNRDWPPEKPPCIIPGSEIPPAKPMDPRRAQQLCRAITDKNMKSQCVFDATVTGEAGFAKTYLVTQKKLGK